MQEASTTSHPNGHMPVTGFFHREDLSFPLYAATITEAICRSFELDVTCHTLDALIPETILNQTWTVTVQDPYGETRVWHALCTHFSQHLTDAGVWAFTCHLVSPMHRLKNTPIRLRGDAAVDLKTWVKALLTKHDLAHSMDWQVEREITRARLLQVHESDLDCLLRVLAVENMMVLPIPETQQLRFIDSSDKCPYTSVKRLFVIDKADLLQSGGIQIGAFEHEEVYRFVITPDEYWDASLSWEQQDPIRLYSGVPCAAVPGVRAGTPAKPYHSLSYEMSDINKLCDSHHFSMKEQGEGYRYIRAHSNALAMRAGYSVNTVEVAKNNETQCRIQYVKHHLMSFGKSLRYHNALLLQPSHGLWRTVSPPKPTIPLAMQAYTRGYETSPMLDEQGNEFITMTSNISDEESVISVPRARPYVSSEGGFHFPLGDHVEVLISFLYGEPDLPVIIGVLPNEWMKGPVPYQDAKQFVLSTRSGHMLRLDDDPSNPHATLQSSPTHGMVLSNGATPGITVQSDGSLSVNSAHNIAMHATGSCEVTAGEALVFTSNATQRYTSQEGNMNITAKQSLQVMAQKDFMLKSGGDLEVKDKDFHMTVNNTLMHTVKQGDSQYEVAEKFTLSAADKMVIQSDERIIISSPAGNTMCVIDHDEIFFYAEGKCLLTADEITMEGKVSYGVNDQKEKTASSIILDETVSLSAQ